MDDRRRSAKDNGDCIETNILPGDVGVARKLPSSADQARALLWTDRTVGPAIFIGLTRFHFDEHQPAVLPPDEIDFAGAGGHAIVAGDDDNPLPLQVAVCNILTAAAEGVVWRKVALAGMVPEHVGEFVQATHHS